MSADSQPEAAGSEAEEKNRNGENVKYKEGYILPGYINALRTSKSLFPATFIIEDEVG